MTPSSSLPPETLNSTAQTSTAFPAGVVGLIALLGPALSLWEWIDSGKTLSWRDGPGVFLFALPISAAVLLFIRRFEAAIVARACLWCMLLWAALLSVAAKPPNGTILLWGVGIGAALLLLQVQSLDTLPGGGPYRTAPVKGPLQAVLTMSIADTLALLFFGNLGLRTLESLPVLIAGVVMAIVVVGLTRLSTWAFVLNVVANIGIAVMAWCIDAPASFAAALTATAVLQLIAGLPVSLSLMYGRDLSGPPGLGRFAAAATISIAIAMMVGAILLK